jgi:hypothetical protein
MFRVFSQNSHKVVILSAVSGDESVRRSAQDDDFVGVEEGKISLVRLPSSRLAFGCQ